MALTEIDGKSANAIKFERIEKEGRSVLFNLTFSMHNKNVAKLAGLNAETLQDAAGEKNAKAIQESQSPKGTLKGTDLDFVRGLSPEENARRIIEKEESKAPDMGTLDPSTLEALTLKRNADSAAVRAQLSQQREDAINAVAKDKQGKEEGVRVPVDGGDNEVQSDEVFSTAEEDRLP